MGRNSATPELQSPAEVTATAAASTATATAGAGGGSNNGDVGFRSNHERLLFKRTQTHLPMNMSKSADRHYRPQFRSRRKAFFALKGNSMIYSVILLAVFGFAMASMMLQSSIMSVFRQGGERGRFLMRRRQGLKFGSSLEFVPAKRLEREGSRLDRVRTEARVAVRLPSIALILGNMKKNPESLMLFTVMKNLRQIGYTLKLYAVEDGEARTMWEQIGGHMSILNHERFGHLDWSLFEGVVADSLETKEIVSSLMQEPFCSVPFIWIIQEHTLANRLLHYSKMGWDHLISHWRSAFSRANAVVFSDYSFPMLYSVLDSGNFFVIPGSPIDVWAAENYVKSHSKHNLRKSHGYDADDLLVLVIGSLFFYDELSWDYAVAMHTVGPLLVKYAMRKDVGGSFKFIFLCGNSTDGYNDVLQDITRRLGLSPGSIKHHGMNSDVNALLLMADIVLYGSSQNEQGFPPLLTRAMSLGVPIIAPDVPVIKRYVSFLSFLDFVSELTFEGSGRCTLAGPGCRDPAKFTT